MEMKEWPNAVQTVNRLVGFIHYSGVGHVEEYFARDALREYSSSGALFVAGTVIRFAYDTFGYRPASFVL